MRTQRIETPNGAIAVHESEGQGPAAVLIHGNSSSSRAFSKQLDGPLGERFRLVAIDLPGHDLTNPLILKDSKMPESLSPAGDGVANRAGGSGHAQVDRSDGIGS
jgi:pimeloyl-ACP methyl ester carboxylesterase